LTHAYLLGSDTRYTSTNVPSDASGQELWANLVSEHENFEMTFNGHFGGDGAGYLASTADEGNTVHQMFINTQFETHGGDGWIRILEFLEDGTTVRARTYSPLWDMHRTHSDFSFTFQLSPLPPQGDGDYNNDGFVDAADYVAWRKTVGTANLLADGDGDGDVDEHDLAHWKARFGNSTGGGALAAVPEPASLIMLLLGACLFVLRQRPPRRFAP
jgi:hypothetical protein